MVNGVNRYGGLRAVLVGDVSKVCIAQGELKDSALISQFMKIDQ